MVLLGDKLRKLRTDRKMTQKQTAQKLGITISAVSGYESCTRCPSYEVLIKYAYLFHVSTDYILGIDKKDYIDVSDLDGKYKEALLQLAETFRKLH